MQKWIMGVDEAGRGPLAGPVAVGVALLPTDFDWSLLSGVNDSKQLSEKKREEIFASARKLKASGHLDYSVAMVSAGVIDKRGIVPSIKLAMDRAFNHLEKNNTIYRSKRVFLNSVLVKLDGGLRAPAEYKKQETIIKGDSKEKVIGLASIMAKVTRDRYMRRRASLAAFTPYDFATHKGYGTKAHREAIANYGLSPEHRVSYCKNIKML